jgi:DNA-binding Lrp family transcriptional regulator
MEEGIIRAFGPVFDVHKLGYGSTLIAAGVENDYIAGLAAAMMDITEITHNYLRDHTFNIWFTISARTAGIMENITGWVRRFPGVLRVLNLPAVEVYKVNAVFGDTMPAPHPSKPGTGFRSLNDDEKTMVRYFQDRFTIEENPFERAANSLHMSESRIINTINSWLDEGVIRRFGARLDHRSAGYTANCLVAWKGGDIDSLGRLFASMPRVSHCYRRKPCEEFPYELYTMVHASSERELEDLLFRMTSLAPKTGYITLKTLKELKKTTMKYFVEDGRWDTP